MAAVQFYGIDTAIRAAESRGITRWALFCGKPMLHKYEGTDPEESTRILQEFLEAIQESTAVYTLKFFEDDIKIKENTPCDGSFNFRLVNEEERNERVKFYSSGSANALAKRIEELEAKLEEKELEETEGMGSIGNIFLGLLKEPEKLGALINIGKSLLFGSKNKNMQPGTINGVPETGSDERIVAAITTLRENDPKICEHLEKLAKISTTNPAMFQTLIGMLDKM